MITVFPSDPTLLNDNGKEPLTQLCYVSSATRLMSTDDLKVLLKAARRHNAAHGITGMLLYKDLSFLQVLEGPPETVLTLYGQIRTDARHTKIRMLFEQPIGAREFADWSMGFQNLDGTDFSEVEGFSDLMRIDGNARSLFANPTRAKRLLLLFRARS